jgi:hypothetical protein
MEQAGSGGIGAVSIGISEWIVWLVILIVLLLLVLGAWKLVKLFWAIQR